MTLLLKKTLLLIWLELLKIEHQITRIPGLINYCTTQEHEMNSFGTVTWFVKVQWVAAQCHKWVKNMWKAPGSAQVKHDPAHHSFREVRANWGEPHWAGPAQNSRCTQAVWGCFGLCLREMGPDPATPAWPDKSLQVPVNTHSSGGLSISSDDNDE